MSERLATPNSKALKIISHIFILLHLILLNNLLTLAPAEPPVKSRRLTASAPPDPKPNERRPQAGRIK